MQATAEFISEHLRSGSGDDVTTVTARYENIGKRSEVDFAIVIEREPRRYRFYVTCLHSLRPELEPNAAELGRPLSRDVLNVRWLEVTSSGFKIFRPSALLWPRQHLTEPGRVRSYEEDFPFVAMLWMQFEVAILNQLHRAFGIFAPDEGAMRFGFACDLTPLSVQLDNGRPDAPMVNGFYVYLLMYHSKLRDGAPPFEGTSADEFLAYEESYAQISVARAIASPLQCELDLAKERRFGQTRLFIEYALEKPPEGTIIDVIGEGGEADDVSRAWLWADKENVALQGFWRRPSFARLGEFALEPPSSPIATLIEDSGFWDDMEIGDADSDRSEPDYSSACRPCK